MQDKKAVKMICGRSEIAWALDYFQKFGEFPKTSKDLNKFILKMI